MIDEQLAQTAKPVWTRRDEVSAFYSGHSLTDGVPEAVSEIATSLGRKLEFEFQSAGYSLLRDRTKGDPDASGFVGYQTGSNRSGQGLDVARELEAPTRLTPPARYDALVVTERHDLPEVAASAQTPTYLADIAQRAQRGNPQVDVFFYHVWMPIDVDDPLPWVQYERSVRPLWECVASRANQILRKQNSGARPIRVLPGGSALADLVGELWRGSVPGLSHLKPSERVGLLFRDEVHMSPIGEYFMGLLHYAFLFGQSPHGAVARPGIDVDTAAHLQGLASRYAESYGKLADAAANRSMASCRELGAQSCSALHAFKSGGGPLGLLKQKTQSFLCARRYRDPKSEGNPFRD